VPIVFTDIDTTLTFDVVFLPEDEADKLRALLDGKRKKIDVQKELEEFLAVVEISLQPAVESDATTRVKGFGKLWNWIKSVRLDSIAKGFAPTAADEILNLSDLPSELAPSHKKALRILKQSGVHDPLLLLISDVGLGLSKNEDVVVIFTTGSPVLGATTFAVEGGGGGGTIEYYPDGTPSLILASGQTANASSATTSRSLLPHISYCCTRLASA